MKHHGFIYGCLMMSTCMCWTGMHGLSAYSLRAPIYPPATISFAVGATPHALCKVEGASRPVRATARWQVLATCSVLGHYALRGCSLRG